MGISTPWGVGRTDSREVGSASLGHVNLTHSILGGMGTNYALEQWSRPWHQSAWVQNPALPCTSCMTWDRLFKPSLSQL